MMVLNMPLWIEMVILKERRSALWNRAPKAHLLAKETTNVRRWITRDDVGHSRHDSSLSGRETICASVLLRQVIFEVSAVENVKEAVDILCAEGESTLIVEEGSRIKPVRSHTLSHQLHGNRRRAHSITQLVKSPSE